MKTRRVALYLRVSTAAQNCAAQRRAIGEFIRRRGWQIAATFTEKKSGAIASRPELDKLLQAARAGGIDAIVVYKLDRLGRSSLHLAQIAEEMARLKVAIVTSSEGIDTSEDNPMGRFVLDILAAIARLERPRRREQPPVQRQQIGLRHRALVGHRDTQQDLALPLGISDSAATGIRLGAARLACYPRAFVEQRDDPPVERIDPPPKPPQLSRLGRLPAALSHAPPTAVRSTRVPGDNRQAPSQAARDPAGSTPCWTE